MARSGFDVDWILAADAKEFSSAIHSGRIDLILVDNGLPGFSGRAALDAAHKACPEVPLIFVSGAANEEQVDDCMKAGAADFVLKDHLWQLPNAVRRLSATKAPPPAPAPPPQPAEEHAPIQNRSMMRLVSVVQELSLARSLEEVAGIVRHAARQLTGADGATFVLRENDKCHYVDEDAIEPLWKGQRFPLNFCVSGWAMLNRESVIVPDIYADPRVPAAAYRPTFVKSMVMVPIRTRAPIGAIGNYWATPHEATAEEVQLLEALANSTALALENVQVYAELEQRVEDRTLQLAMANRELEAFSYSVSHDLRTPLRSISMLVNIIEDNRAKGQEDEVKRNLGLIEEETRNMSGLIEDLLRLSRLSKVELHRTKVSLSAMAQKIVSRFQASSSDRRAEFRVQAGLEVFADEGLLNVVLENLLSNAWKYTSRRPQALIEFGTLPQGEDAPIYFIRDNGAGFNMRYADKLFSPFQRFHSPAEFEGTGVGLATVQRIIHRHGGRIWAESEVDHGATFFFTLPHPVPLIYP
jgi:signal transduction histidine kinase